MVCLRACFYALERTEEQSIDHHESHPGSRTKTASLNGSGPTLFAPGGTGPF